MSTLSRTDVVNIALAHLGDHRINDFDEAKPAAANARDQWELALRDSLSAYEWSFASRIARLDRNSSVPVAGYRYRYDMPADSVLLIQISDSTRFPADDVFRRWWYRDGYIETDAEQVFADYVYYHDTVGSWPPYFVDHLAVSLARRLNPRVTTSQSSGKLLTELQQQALTIARARDARQQPIQRPPRGRWYRARRGGGLFWR